MPEQNLPKLAARTSFWIAMRYLFAQRSQFATFITWTSIIGLALGVAVLIVVVSVMNGFDGELRHRLLNTVAHLVVNSEADLSGAVDLELKQDSQHSNIVARFPFYEGEGMVSQNGAVNPVIIHGLHPQALTQLEILYGSLGDKGIQDFSETERGVLIGEPLAAHLGLYPGDDLIIVYSEPKGDSVRPQFGRFRLAATFQVGAELDYGLIILRLGDIAGSSLEKAGTTGVRLVLGDPLDAPELRDQLGSQNVLSVWTDSYGELFRAVRLEKAMMFVILTLIVAVAAFNIVSGQMMLVNEKRSDLAILQTMGAHPRSVLSIFLLQGLAVAFIGIILGIGLGLVFAYNIADWVYYVENSTSVRLLEGTYFSRLPVQVELTDLLFITAISSIICLFAALHPARRALAANPIAALHGL